MQSAAFPWHAICNTTKQNMSTVSRVTQTASVSAQNAIIAFGKANMRSAPSLSSFLKIAIETVTMFVWLNTDRSGQRWVDYRPLPFSTPLSFRLYMLWCFGLSMSRKFLKPLNTSALPSCRSDVIYAVFASLSARVARTLSNQQTNYLLVHSHWLRRAQGSKSTEVFAAKTMHVCVPVGAAHSRLHILQEVHWVYENDGMCNLCITLGG